MRVCAGIGRLAISGLSSSCTGDYVSELQVNLRVDGAYQSRITVNSNEPYSSSQGILGWRRCSMDLYGTGRLAAKDAESAIVARIQEDFT